MKNKLRSEILKKRDALPLDLKKRKDDAIRNMLLNLEEFIDSKTVLMYASFRTEVDTIKELQDIICLGKNLIVPLVNSRDKTLSLYEIKDTSELEPGYMGIPEPNVSEDRKADLNNIDIAVIPGTGFDIKGNRLGYGGGYYDRLLSEAANIPRIALAFEEQIVESIPAEPHDMKMDIIITDEKIIRITN